MVFCREVAFCHGAIANFFTSQEKQHDSVTVHSPPLESDRPGGNEPGGYYDGTFLADYEYIEGAGTLDECNGRMTVSPEFPDGTYAYFLTSDFPNIPRCFKGTPSQDFAKGGSRR